MRNSTTTRSAMLPLQFQHPVTLYLILLLAVITQPQTAHAATSDAQLQQYIISLCGRPAGNLPPGWDAVSLNAMCANTQGGFAGGTAGGSVSANIGSVGASSGLTHGGNDRERREKNRNQVTAGASADDGGWGFMIAPQYGKSDRPDSVLENGYKSDLAGLMVGVDHRYSDTFVLGATIGQTRDKATFLTGGGSLKTRNNLATLYGTWLPSDDIAVDGYLGYGKLNYDSQRHVAFGTINGYATGATTGSQVLAGTSATYLKELGRYNLAPFITLDYIKTKFKNYSEQGATTLEMHYGDRSTLSLTSSVGSRVSTSYGRDWGSLEPMARFAFVHEFQNRFRQISNELISTPGTGFLVETDSPDRNYLLLSLGISAAMNSGTQLYADFEKRTQDRFLSSWSLSAGVLMGF